MEGLGRNETHWTPWWKGSGSMEGSGINRATHNTDEASMIMRSVILGAWS